MANWLTGKSYSGPEACDSTPDVTCTYDAFDGVTRFGRGRRTGMSSATDTASWVYDLRGRVTSETRNIIGAPSAYTTSSTYDAFGRVLAQTRPGGEVLTYGYNNMGTLASVTSSLDPQHPYIYRR